VVVSQGGRGRGPHGLFAGPARAVRARGRQRGQDPQGIEARRDPGHPVRQVRAAHQHADGPGPGPRRASGPHAPGQRGDRVMMGLVADPSFGIFTIAALLLLITPGPAVLYTLPRSTGPGAPAPPPSAL